MQKYVNQLIEDIEEIIEWKIEGKTLQKIDSFEEQMEEVEKYISTRPSKTFGDYTGLTKIQFPPPERLSFQQMNELANALDRLLFTFHIRANLPEILPVAVAYQALVDLLDRAVMIMNRGLMGIEFCSYDCQNCPWDLAYCTCIEHADEAGKEMLQNKVIQPIAPKDQLFDRQITEIDYWMRDIDNISEDDSFPLWGDEDSDDDIPF